MFLLRGRLAPSPDPTPLASVRPHSAEREMQQEEEEEAAPASQPSLCAPSSSLAPGPIPLRSSSSSARLRRRPGFWGAPRTVYGNIRELRPTPRSRFGMYTYISHFPTLFRGNVEAKNIAEWCEGNGRGFPRGIRKLVACKQKRTLLSFFGRDQEGKKSFFTPVASRENLFSMWEDMKPLPKVRGLYRRFFLMSLI